MAVAAIAPSAAQVAGARQSVVARKSFSGVAGLDYCRSVLDMQHRDEMLAPTGHFCSEQYWKCTCWSELRGGSMFFFSLLALRNI